MKKKNRLKIRYRFEHAQVALRWTDPFPLAELCTLINVDRVDVRSSETSFPFHPRRNGTLLAEKKGDPPTTRHVNHHMVGETWLFVLEL